MRNYLKFLSSTLLPSVPQPPPGLEQITRRSWRGETESERAGHVSDASLDWCARVCVCVCVYLCTKFDIRICHKGIILDCMTAFNHRIIKQFISFSPGATLQPPSPPTFTLESRRKRTRVCVLECVYLHDLVSILRSFPNCYASFGGGNLLPSLRAAGDWKRWSSGFHVAWWATLNLTYLVFFGDVERHLVTQWHLVANRREFQLVRN